MDCNIVGPILAGMDHQLHRSGKTGDWVRSLSGRNMPTLMQVLFIHRIFSTAVNKCLCLYMSPPATFYPVLASNMEYEWPFIGWH